MKSNLHGLVELCLDSEQRVRLGSAGYKRLQERFTPAKQKLTEILLRFGPESIG